MKTVTSVTLSDVEKRRHPSKHYVYVMFVRWSDGGQYAIYRRYSRFFDLQSTLLDKFPIEAGSIEPTQRILPILPGKILFGRSHVREVAMKRLKPIDEYCQALINMPDNISQCDEVLAFFEVEDEYLDPPKAEDVSSPCGFHMKSKKEPKADKISVPKQLKRFKAISDYVKQERGEITLHAGAVVELVEQSESGWWFVNAEDEQGYAPSTYLEPIDGGRRENTTHRATPGQEEKYMCIETVTPTGDDELHLEKGAIVEVVEKNMEGWWLVRYQGKEGWAPTTYLCKTRDQNVLRLAEKGRASGVEIIGDLSDISELMSNKGENNTSSISRTDGDTRKSVGSGSDLYSKVNKGRSLERGGSLRPPPRQNSIEPKTGVNSSGSPTKPACRYVTVADFQDTVGDGISFKTGQTVTVHEKAAGGWWYVESEGQEGWAPSSYIQQEATKKESFEPRQGIPDVEEEDEWDTLSDDVDTTHSKDEHQPSSVPSSVYKPTPPPKDEHQPSSVPSSVYKPTPPPKKPSLPPKVEKGVNSVTTTKSSDTDRPNVSNIAGALKAKFESRQQHEEKPTLSVGSKSNLPRKPPLPAKVKGGSSYSYKEEERSGVVVTKLPTVLSPREKSEIQTAHRPNKPIGNKPTPPAKLPSKTGSPKPASSSHTAAKHPPRLPSKPKSADNNNNKDVSKSNVPNVHGITDAMKSKFEKAGSFSKDPKSEPHMDARSKPSSGIAQGLAAKFNNLNTTSAQKPQLPVSKPHSGQVRNSKATFEGKKTSQHKRQEELKNVRASGNVSGLISALGNQLNFDEKPHQAKRRSWTPSDQGSDYPAMDPVCILPVAGKTSGPKSSTGFVAKDTGFVAKDTGFVTKDTGLVTKDKYTATASFAGDGENEMSFEAEEMLEVLDKSDDSWWLVRKTDGTEGYIPASYLKQTSPVPRRVAAPTTGKTVYKTVSMFTAEQEGEVGFDEGEVVDVIEKTDGGWWMVRVLGGGQGWAPSDFIKEEHVTAASKPTPPPKHNLAGKPTLPVKPR